MEYLLLLIILLVVIRLARNTYGLFLYAYFLINYFDDDVSRETYL